MLHAARQASSARNQPARKLSVHQGGLDSLEADTLALGVFEGQVGDNELLRAADQLFAGRLLQALAEDDFRGSRNQETVFHTVGAEGLAPRRVMVVGLGARRAFDVAETAGFADRAARRCRDWSSRVLALGLPPVDPVVYSRAARFAAQGIATGIAAAGLSSETKLVVGPQVHLDPLTLSRGALIGEAVCLARSLGDWANSAGVGWPELLVEQARALSSLGIEVNILDHRLCKKQGLGLLAAGGRGGEPCLLHLVYKPRGRDRPSRRYALVGDGARAVDSFERCRAADGAGAASVLATMSVLRVLGVTAEVHGIVAAAEVRLTGRAGELLRGLGGQTVELTCPEGAQLLPLAEALSYSSALGADEVIDLGSSTAAAIAALGPDIAPVVGKDWALVERFLGASRRVGERAWHLPIPEWLNPQPATVKANISTRGLTEHALMPGLFLSAFVGKMPWIHVDVTGPGYAESLDDRRAGGATGFGVASLVEYLTSRDGLS